MHEIFLSYSHKDKELADMMLNILEQYGIKCWIDSRDALPGDSFAASIVHAIKSCKFFVLLLSTASGDSAHVLNEVNSAVKAGKTIIPFKIDDYEMSEGLEYYLGKTQWLEAISPPMEAHMKDLAATILGWLKMQPVPRPQPVPLSDARNKDVCKILSFQDSYRSDIPPKRSHSNSLKTIISTATGSAKKTRARRRNGKNFYKMTATPSIISSTERRRSSGIGRSLH